MRSTHFIISAAAAAIWLGGMTCVYAQDEHVAHHADDAASAPTDAEAGTGRSSGDTGDGMKGCPMMAGGKGMMGRDKGMMAGMKGGQQAPTVVINIYAGGEVATTEVGAARRGHWMHHGMMAGGDGGKGMMGRHGRMMGHAMGQGDTALEEDLSEDGVRTLMEKHLKVMGHGDLKVGQVALIDDDLASVEIVTAADESHHRMVVNRHTGQMMRVN